MTHVPRDAARDLIADCGQLVKRVRRLARGEDSTDLDRAGLERAAAHVRLALESLQDPEPDALASTAGMRRTLTPIVERILGRRKKLEAAELREQLARMRAPRRPQAAVLRGRGAAIPVPEMLGFLQTLGKTGVLLVSLPNERVHLELLRGRLVGAFSDNSPPGSRLGEILVSQGAVGAEVLESFLVYYRADQGRIGKALELERLVTDKTLNAALSEQVQRLFHRLLEHCDVPYSFEERPVEAEEGIELSVMHLLLESARTRDERLAPSPNAVEPLPPAPEPPAALPALPFDLAEEIERYIELREELRPWGSDRVEPPAGGSEPLGEPWP
jgi:hypothetical protein